MKLRINAKLRAAVIAAISVVGFSVTDAQAYSRELTTVTTSGGGTTYNGYVFTMLNGSGNFSGRHFKQATYSETSWVDGETEYASGNKDIETPLGTGWFWTMYCSTSTASNGLAYGNTLRLSGAASQQKLTTDFSDFTIGGLIADDNFQSSFGTPAYWLYRGGSMDINGSNAVNMDVDSHVRFSYGGSVNMKKGGTWNIHSGKTLTFDNNSSNTATTFNFYEGQALTVQGGGTLYLGRSSNGTYNVNMKEGSSLHVTGNSTVKMEAAGTLTANGAITVDSGSTLNISLSTTMGQTITNNGTTSFSNGVTLASDAKLVNGGALTINGTITFGANAIENNGSGAITFGSGIHFDLTGMTAVENKYTLFSGTGAAIDLSGYNTSYITVAGGTAGKTWSFNNDGTISFTVSSGKVWTNGAGTGKWNYEDANWDGATFESGDVAQFNDYSEVTVNADVVAGGIQANGLVFIGNDEQTPGSLTSPSVEVADEAYLFTTLTVEGVESYTVGAEGAWTISADQTLAAGTGSGDGIINVMDGGSVTFTATATEADWSRVANDGTVNMNLGGATAKIDMSDSSGGLD